MCGKETDRQRDTERGMQRQRQRENEHEPGKVGSWRSCGKEKNIIKIYCKKNFKKPKQKE